MTSQYLIDKKYLSEEELGGEALLVLIGLRIRYRHPEIYLDKTLLSIYIFGEDFTDYQRGIITKGLNELIENKVIIVTKTISNIIVCNISNILDVQKGVFYAAITKDEFFSIVNLKEDISVCRILKYFLNLIGTFDARKKTDEKYRYKIGSFNQKAISQMCRIDVATMIKYNKILTKNKIIYIAKRKAIATNKSQSGRIYNQMTNVYSKFIDKDLCEEYIKEHGYKKQNNEFINISNEMRSLSQKYNYFARTYKNKKCENMDKVEDAYEAAVQWNEYAKQDYEKAIEDGKNPKELKYKDLSIFNQYDLTV